MSDIAILSAENSSLMNSALQGSGGSNKEVFIYSMEAPLPSHFRSRENKSQILGVAMGGNSYQVEVPAFGTLKSMYLRWNVKWRNGTDNCVPAVARAMGAHMIKKVRLVSSSRTILELTGTQIQYLVYAEKDDRKRAGMKRAMRDVCVDNVVSTTGGTAGLNCPDGFATIQNDYGFIATDAEGADKQIYIYTPLPFSCFNHLKTMIPTDFCEKLILEIETSNHHEIVCGGSGANTTLATDFAVNNCFLCSEFLVLNSDDRKAIQEKNYSIGSPLAMLLTDWKTTTKQIAGEAGSTTTSLNVFFTELCAGMLCYVEPVRTFDGTTRNGNLQAVGETGKSAGSTAASAIVQSDKIRRGVNGVNVKGTYAHIKKITISAGGRKLASFLHDELLYMNGALPSSVYIDESKEEAEECDAFGNSKNNLYYINFSNTHELDALKGQLALRGLNSVVVDIEFASVNTGSLKYDVNACIQYYKAVQISGDSGAIATALSN